MSRKTLSKLISALLCLALLAGCAAFAEEELVATQVEAPVPESELAAALEDLSAEPTAVEAPEPMAVEAPVAPMAAAEVVPMTATPLVIAKKGSATIDLGEQVQLLPDLDGVLFIAWKSSKGGVASVDEGGVVTALAKGKTKITGTTADKKKYTLKLKVVDPYEPTGIGIAEGKSGSTTILQPLQLNAVLQPATAQSDLIWSSSKPKVATVSPDGLVSPLSKGKAKITVKSAKNKKIKAVFKLTVTNPYEPGAISIAQGTSGATTIAQSLQLNAVLEPATAMSALTWKSSKPKIATVDSEGLVTPLSEGKTKITVTTDNKKKASFTLTVTNPYKPGAIGIAQGASGVTTVAQPLQLDAVLEPATAMSVLKWKSSKKKVATVDGNGLVTPHSEGKTKITVTTDNKKKATFTLTVTDPNKPAAIGIAEGSALTLTAGQTLQLTPVLEPATAIATLTWKSSRGKVATVDANGVVTAVGKGNAKITVQAANNKKVKATITINVAAGETPPAPQPEPAPAPVDGKDLSAWLGQPATAAESTLGLKVEVESSSDGIRYMLNGNNFFMYAKGADYASSTITWVALEGQGKSDLNICGFNVMGMTYDQALEKAKADKWTVTSNDDFGNFRGLILKKGDKWLRITDNKSRLVSAIAYAYAAS